MGIFANFNILNQRGTPAMFSDALANRPAPGFVGRIFIDTDIPTTGIYRDTGTSWELIAGGVPATPNLQEVTDVGNTTTNNVIMQSRAIVGGTATQSFHRLIVRDTGIFTTQRETLSIERTHTYDGTGTFSSGPAYGSLAGADTLTQTASITIPNGVSSATGMFSGVTLRPGGFNITQTQGAGLRALSAYRTQLTIEQTAVTSSVISDYAHFFATAIYKVTNSNPVTITNNYGLAISDQTEVSTGLTLTNRYGVAQFGANDRNFFLGRVGIGTSTDAGFQFDVNGTGRITGDFRYNGNLNVTATVAYCLSLSASAGGASINAFTNGGASALQKLEFGFYTTSLNSSSGFSNPAHNNYSFRLYGTHIAVNTGGGTYTDLRIAPTYNFTGNLNAGIAYGISFEPIATNLTLTTVVAFRNTIGRNIFNETSGNTIIGSATDVASAKLAVVSTTQGFLPPVMTEAQINAISTPAEGLMVYNSTDKTFEVRDASLWQNVPNGLKASATLDFPNTAAANSSDLTITVTNAALNDMVLLGVPNGSVIANTCYTAFVSAANTVTVRFNNYSGAAQNPASGTFRVYVIKN